MAIFLVKMELKSRLIHEKPEKVEALDSNATLFFPFWFSRSLFFLLSWIKSSLLENHNLQNIFVAVHGFQNI